jgi:transcriptional regulator with XRE-family HTH domain
MTRFKDFLKEQFKEDNELEKDFYKGLEKSRIAIEIAVFREKAGLTQAELARRVGTSQSAIARMENADYQNYSIRTLRKIAEVLGLELLVSLRDKKLPAEPALKPQKIVSLQEYRLKSRSASGSYEFPGPFFKPQKKTMGA